MPVTYFLCEGNMGIEHGYGKGKAQARKRAGNKHKGKQQFW